jgi:hypothetical protein
MYLEWVPAGLGREYLQAVNPAFRVGSVIHHIDLFGNFHSWGWLLYVAPIRLWDPIDGEASTQAEAKARLWSAAWSALSRGVRDWYADIVRHAEYVPLEVGDGESRECVSSLGDGGSSASRCASCEGAAGSNVSDVANPQLGEPTP